MSTLPHPPRVRAIIQRTLEASVTCDATVVSSIAAGLLILLGVEDGDTEDDIAWLAPKIARLRIFSDADGKMNLSVEDTGGGVIVVSQFTLHASTRKGNRPSFLAAAPPALAEALYGQFCEVLGRELGKPVGRGVFGGDMKVALVNDGPVTILIDTRLRE